MDNLPLLRDIHLPEESLFFPLGYGWILIFAMPIVIYFGYRIFKYVQTKSKKYYALMLLKNAQDNSLESAIKISEILRRICLYKYKNAVSLFGNEWVDFLNAHTQKKLSSDAAELLIYAPYVKKDKVFKNQDYQILREFAKRWIGENL